MTDRGGGKNTIERRVPSVVPTADLRVCIVTVAGVAGDTRIADSRCEVEGIATGRAAFRTGMAGIVR